METIFRTCDIHILFDKRCEHVRTINKMPLIVERSALKDKDLLSRYGSKIYARIIQEKDYYDQ